ncbi:class I SAM-dependent methyltransferase [Hyphobacterium marinum]|uniref:Methyltransferase domain-containing protein n=1 Tax=Hyphobacterium marinum TaxID=3116574 RepID=A0ABU7LU58_9PROT|nr:methyltransferase domain-containing protein [Hyphobacterium sp. Y6023]MEE2565085.1 methyltransferase domain-containing protein [Hyphobacterium sp. Y6023]
MSGSQTKSGTAAPGDFFNAEMAARYDERNSKLSPISDCMHFLFRLALENLPETARILCVGVGTGAEILSLSKARPGWRFVGVDPSGSMLDVCREQLHKAGILDRCDLVEGEVHDILAPEAFDAVLTIMVAHFVDQDERPRFYRAIHDRLRPGGCYVSTEISHDLDAADFPSMLTNWGRIQSLMGANPDSLNALPDTLRNVLAVVSPADTEALWRQAGFDQPVCFFQAFMARGWYGWKNC